MRISPGKLRFCSAAILLIPAATFAQTAHVPPPTPAPLQVPAPPQVPAVRPVPHPPPPAATYTGAAGLDDAKAGLDALNRGDNETAILLFSQALGSGALAPADEELAYVRRAQAFLAEKRNDLALSDLDQAQKLDPNDKEAADLRAQVTAITGSPSLAESQSYDQTLSYIQANSAQGHVTEDDDVLDISFSRCKVSVVQKLSAIQITYSFDLGAATGASSNGLPDTVSSPARRFNVSIKASTHTEIRPSPPGTKLPDWASFGYAVAEMETARRLANAWTHLIALCKAAPPDQGADDPFK